MKQQQQSERIDSFTAAGSKITNAISILQKKHYGCLSKIFCCKCFYCCQDFDFSLLTSKKRKGLFEQMVKRYLKSMHKSNHKANGNLVMDPFFILVALLLGQQSQIYNELLSQVRNVNQGTIFSKQDLQFYIPQLCTYLVFHQQMGNIQLSTLMQRACKIDLHFSLRYYFFMKSLQVIVDTHQIQKFTIVQKYNTGFRNKINLVFKLKHQKKSSFDNNSSIMIEQKQNLIGSKTLISGKKIQPNDSCHKQKENENVLRQSITGSKRSSLTSSTFSMQQKSQKALQNQQNIKICQIYNQDIVESTNYTKIKFLQLSQVYKPVVQKIKEDYPLGLFQSTATFFFDLVQISRRLKTSQNRLQDLKQYLLEMNKQLPSTVYVPFTKRQYQGINIASIVIKQCKVFSTKQRAPFYICFEGFYNPNHSQQSHRQKKIKSIVQIQQTHKLRRSALFQQDIMLQIQDQNNEKQNPNDISEQKMTQQKGDIRSSTQGTRSGKNIDLKKIKKNIWDKFFQLTNKAKQLVYEENKQSTEEQNFPPHNNEETISNTLAASSNYSQKTKINKQKGFKSFKGMEEEKQSKAQTTSNNNEESQNDQQQEYRLFGQSKLQLNDRISSRSPLSMLPGYKLIQLVVKSHDDLRQECFAMQLLQEFERIFKMENLPINLEPYQVMPISHDSGLIEFVNQAITIDQLIKKQGSLSFVKKNKTKMKNFVSSLAGYSLVTYFLQVKDRHNGNIMIKRNGTILHIDYGFFFSNMPGKGVQLQKNVPFKLTNQYIEAMGGLKSKWFAQFRKLFYQGFNALRKHQHRIIILTKLMYSSYGTTMPCFLKGDEAIQKLNQRFNPRNVHTDGQLSLFCQELVNSSLENWRAKWYDRWQYFAQGILY